MDGDGKIAPPHIDTPFGLAAIPYAWASTKTYFIKEYS